ncbi:heterokaryon incompatibility protein-domain-containing protein [Lasiosphaeris hirsuta]|uniref:Heterokaryon incompatibility protein-domain-containing protein n=1 Tax=Lasiosphaeris hirsuta TaxID=260670 RepID=A0AA40ANP7_9PEZI|nr:heterokaryon incompatibility protein-domain-containing protein [Lasiosphaeris hirsuta]
MADLLHDCRCRRPDIRYTSHFISCVSCGSTNPLSPHQSAPSDPLPPSDGVDFMTPAAESSDDEELISSGPLARSSRGPSYAYGKLRQKHHIRLLCILPGSFDDILHCALAHENLSRLPVYDAISYTWADDSGDRSKNKAILLGSGIFMVTTSCHLALQRVRLQGCRTVWIDAVCINQDDTDERCHQVQLMARIYASARSVLVYIGEGSTESSETVNLLALGLSLAGKEAAVTALLASPYFWRVWVLQEIALARKATLICGDASIPWPNFAKQIRELPHFGKMAFDALLTRPPPHHTYGGFGDQGARWATLRDEARQISGVPLALSFEAPKFRSIEELPRLLDLSSFCEATDPRDKVYALLGLATGTEGYGFLPDYDTDLEHVYVKTAILIAASCGPLALLVRAVCRRSISPTLPWVPDWRSYSPVSPSLGGDISILEEIRRGAYHTNIHTSLPPKDLNIAQSFEFTTIGVGSLQNLLKSGVGWSAHFFPAQDSPNLVLGFSPGVLPLESAQDDLASVSTACLWELADSLCLFQVQSEQPPTSGSETTAGGVDSCLVLSTMPPGYLSLAGMADSIVDLPFLGLIKFFTHPYVSLPERVSQIKFTWGRPVRVRMSRQSPEQDYPDIQNPHLSQIGLQCVTLAQSKRWTNLRGLGARVEQTLQQLHEWQQQSLQEWQNYRYREHEAWDQGRQTSLPELIWELWLITGLRGWQFRKLPRQDPSEDVTQERRQSQELQDQEWRELQEMRERRWQDLQRRKSYMQAKRERIWFNVRKRRRASPGSLLKAEMIRDWPWSKIEFGELELYMVNRWVHRYDTLHQYLEQLSELEPLSDEELDIKWQQQSWLEEMGKKLEHTLWELSEVLKRDMQEEAQREEGRWKIEEREKEQQEREQQERSSKES